VSVPTSPDEDYEEPPSLLKRHCDECRSELGETETCVRALHVAVALPSPLSPSPRALSSTFSRGDASSTHTCNTGQIPDDGGIQVEITEVHQGAKLQLTGDAKPEDCEPWGQIQGNQWGDPVTVATWNFTDGVEVQTGTPSPPAETEGTSTFLLSSDGRMTLALCNFLGAGSHGTVVSADWAESYRQVAVKISHKLFISELDSTEPGLRNLKNELDVLKALKQSREYGELGSNFFPELFKSWQDAKNVYFVMDLYPWNLEDLRWANPDWEATTGDKILWTAEMVCFHFAFAPLSYSSISVDSWCPGFASHADLTPRHKACQRIRHVHQAHHHRRLRPRTRLARSILHQLPFFFPESPRCSRNDVLPCPGGTQGILRGRGKCRSEEIRELRV